MTIQQIAVWLGSCVSFEAKSIRAAWCMHSTMTDFALQSKNVSFLNTLRSIFVCLGAILYSSRFEWLAHPDGYSARRLNVNERKLVHKCLWALTVYVTTC